MAIAERHKIRNLGIVAHIDAGKTTLTERFLFYAGKSHKLGEVHDGEAVMDFRPDERERGITISAAATTFYWNEHQVNLIDTPGHVDFTAEVERALRVLDGAVVVFDAVEGVEPQSETVWLQADRYRVPRLVFINKMDRVGADFDASVEAIRDRLKAHPLCLQFPHGSGEAFEGVVDVVHGRYLTFDAASLGKEFALAEVPTELREETLRRRAELVGSLAEVHDPTAELFLTDQEVPADRLEAGIREATLRGSAVPVLCGAALRNKGVQPVLDAVCAYLPAPHEVAAVKGVDPETKEVIYRQPTTSAPFSALVFKVVASASTDTVFLRVYSGSMEAGGRALNPRTGSKERLRRFIQVHADRGTALERVEAGDIVSMTGLSDSVTGDTLCSDSAPILLESIRFPETVVSVAVEPKSAADRDRLTEALNRMQREDPTFRRTVDVDTGQTILSGMGELHLEVVLRRIDRDLGVAVNSGNPRVSYKETVGATGSGEAEYRRQVGGHDLFARVEVGVEPTGDFASPAEVVWRVPEGTVSPSLAASVVEAARNAAEGGGLYGYPVTGIRVVVLSARYAESGQPEIALNSATSLAFRDALSEAGPVVLEPYGRLEVRVPEDHLGNVVKSLNQRRATVEQTKFSKGNVLVRGTAPIGEMFGYLTALRSLTQGRGSLSLEPMGYRPLPESLVSGQHQRLYD